MSGHVWSVAGTVGQSVYKIPLVNISAVTSKLQQPQHTLLHMLGGAGPLHAQ